MKTRTTPNFGPLRAALLGNAVFSLASGLVLSLAGSWANQLLGTNSPIILPLLGIGLMIFAVDLILQASRPRLRTWRALLTTGLDGLWVAGSLILLIFFPDSFSASGLTLIALVAGVVLLFGALQFRGILIAHSGRSLGMYRHCVPVAVEASADEMWKKIGDLGAISRYFPHLKSSVLRGQAEPGVGAIRICENASGKQWAEECVSYREGKEFQVRFLTRDPELPPFPLPVSEMTGGWEILSNNEETCTIFVFWELRPQPNWLAGLLLPILAFQFDRFFPKGIHRMAVEAKGMSLDTEAPKSWAKLLPLPC